MLTEMVELGVLVPYPEEGREANDQRRPSVLYNKKTQDDCTTQPDGENNKVAPQFGFIQRHNFTEKTWNEVIVHVCFRNMSINSVILMTTLLQMKGDPWYCLKWSYKLRYTGKQEARQQ